jgi:hypothetical protein
MTTMLLPEIAMNALRPLDKASGEELPSLPIAELRGLVSTSAIVAEGIGKLWSELRSRLAYQGMQGPELRESVNSFIEVLEIMLRMFSRHANRAAALGAVGEEVFSRVAQTEKNIRAILKEATDISLFVGRPLDPGFMDRVEKAAAEDPGIYISHEEMLASLQNGNK